ncbi:hypothetical protein [Leptolinea tardivitalis]|uniref:Lipoprotein n=1 Tax=Leptolinea tardivitalis TaxID=229920 RepID=A0A0P6XT84_9CHLR|nr:hypothetical protein [Leptolinea tardivitalis]KPL72707.1 hypothetical protein ADM99_06400 [Leptolinea tardivitalis]GAP20949.1 uncharacterized protein conserved in bacteria [Leptolinea tardivitalis]
MKTKKVKIILILSLLVASALACNLPAAVTKSEKKEVIPTIPAAEQQQLENQIASQISQAASGQQITVELTESQLTSLINSKIPATQDAQFSNIQVTLNDNQAQLSGDVVASGISGKVSISLAVSADAEGKPALTITNATLNGFSLPQSMLTNISTSINDGIKGQTGQGFIIQSMSISDHKLIITAQKL